MEKIYEIPRAGVVRARCASSVLVKYTVYILNLVCGVPTYHRILNRGSHSSRSSTKDKCIQIYPQCSCEKHTCYRPAEGVPWLYVKLQQVADLGQKSDRQKVAMRPNGWLHKIILLSRSPSLARPRVELRQHIHFDWNLCQFLKIPNLAPFFAQRPLRVPRT
jgi:hypothetical protein